MCLWVLSQTAVDRCPRPFKDSWNPHPFIYLKPEKGTHFGQSLPAKAIMGVPPGGMKILTSLLYSVDVLYIFAKCNNRPCSRFSPSLHELKVWWDKSDVTLLLRGQTSDNLFQYKKSRSSLFILDNRKWTTFYIKDEMTTYGWKWSLLLL